MQFFFFLQNWLLIDEKGSKKGRHFEYVEGMFNTWISKTKDKIQWIQHIIVWNTIQCPHLILICTCSQVDMLWSYHSSLCVALY
jgi:hypothetical protein